MDGYRTQIDTLFDYVFAHLNIGQRETRVAFHTVYGTHGWSLASSRSYTVSSGNDIIRDYTNDIHDGTYYDFSDSTLFETVRMNLIDPADRPEAPNIVIVIWDGNYGFPNVDMVPNLGR